MDGRNSFIISILSYLGLGINAVISENPELFAGRLNTFCKDMTVKVQSVKENEVILNVSKGEHPFLIIYKKEGSRVKSIEIL